MDLTGLDLTLTSGPKEPTCEEAAPMAWYVPCGQPAVALIHHSGSGERPYWMCSSCADHNVRNRGGVALWASPTRR